MLKSQNVCVHHHTNVSYKPFPLPRWWWCGCYSAQIWVFLCHWKRGLTHFKLHMDRNDLSKCESTQALLTTICHLYVSQTQETWHQLFLIQILVEVFVLKCWCVSHWKLFKSFHFILWAKENKLGSFKI